MSGAALRPRRYRCATNHVLNYLLGCHQPMNTAMKHDSMMLT